MSIHSRCVLVNGQTILAGYLPDTPDESHGAVCSAIARHFAGSPPQRRSGLVLIPELARYVSFTRLESGVFAGRHPSVTETGIAELEAGFLAAAERVKSASGWDETQRRMQSETYPYLVARKRVEEYWSLDEIESERKARSAA